MHERYINKNIDRLFSNEARLIRWQTVELAVCEARVTFKEISRESFDLIKGNCLANPPDIEWWKERDKVIGHDLNAFIEERWRFIPKNLQPYFHDEMTSYDTEEPAFALCLMEATKEVYVYLEPLLDTIKKRAKEFQFTPMMGETHGQPAEVMSFGKRLSSWFQQLNFDREELLHASSKLEFSKLSGAVGNYTGLSPKLEEKALSILGLKPFYGATQIMPREIYAPLSFAMAMLAQTCNKIALDIRLGARGSEALYREPFGKKQKGSSAMPHKKNTITTEKIIGLANMAVDYHSMIIKNIVTWNERAIEQSCVERVAWPDLFHCVIHILDCLQKVLSGLVVYPENMLKEIIKTNGCYATSLAQKYLKEILLPLGLFAEDAYRIIQLASFDLQKKEGALIPQNLSEAKKLLEGFASKPLEPTIRGSIRDVIQKGELSPVEELDRTPEDIEKWNAILKEAFVNEENRRFWEQAFDIKFILRNEEFLYERILT